MISVGLIPGPGVTRALARTPSGSDRYVQRRQAIGADPPLDAAR